MAVIISADELKKTIPQYSPGLSETVHLESTKRADKEFYSALKLNVCKDVILMNGGAAAGKTEFLLTHLNNLDTIILDTTLSTIVGAKITIRKILKANKRPVIYAIIPVDLEPAYNAFLHRERKFSSSNFFRTHSASRHTLLWIANNYENIALNIYESTNIATKMKFERVDFVTHNELLEYLKSIQRSETDIIMYIASKGYST